MATCAEDSCEKRGAVRLHVPWAENRVVCLSHARAWAQKDGVVAEPLDDAEDELP